MEHTDARFEGKLAHIGVDAVSGPTDWAGRSIKLERAMGMQGNAPAPPPAKPNPARMHLDATTGATIDATTGATGRADGKRERKATMNETRSTSADMPVDATSGATADAMTGATVDATTRATVDATSSATVDATTGATSRADAHEPALDRTASAKDADAATGATPGVAAACKELGMSSVADVTRELGIKPPGMA